MHQWRQWTCWLALATSSYGAPAAEPESTSAAAFDPLQPGPLTCNAGQPVVARDTCNALAYQLSNQIFFPGSQQYANETASVWSITCVKQPACVFVPLDVQRLAQGLSTIVGHNTSFTMRSGGHMPVPGHNSFNKGGIMIATTRFTEKTVVAAPNSLGSSYVRVGAAFRWQELYEFLEARNLVCYGGRVTSIGSSLLLGGGLSYFSSVRGWAANSVLQYQVVLANSSIIEVNQKNHPRLWWALKGGSSNFGIVTRYDLVTAPTNRMFGGTVSYAPTDTQKYLDAQQAFILPGGGSDDVKAALMPGTYYSPLTKQNSAGATFVYNQAINNPKAFENFTKIPSVAGSLGIMNFTAITRSTGGFAAPGKRWAFSNVALKSVPGVMNFIRDRLVANADKYLAGVNCTVGTAVQPVTTTHLAAAKKLGGDAINLDPARGAFQIVLVYGQWPDNVADSLIQTFINATLEDLATSAEKKGILYPWLFLNDAGLGQDPLEYYGYGSSLPELKTVARQYDPNGVFQKYVPGFKLERETPAC